MRLENMKLHIMLVDYLQERKKTKKELDEDCVQRDMA